MSVFKRWNGTFWETIGPQISSARFDDTNHMIAPEYSSTSTYNVGDYVVQSDKLYKCISAIESAEEWTPTHWTQISMGGEVSDLNSAFTDSDYILIGKENLINGVTWEDNKYINNNGEVASATNYRLSGKIFVDPKQTYTIIWTNTIGYYRVGAFTSDDSPNGFLINGSNGNRRLLIVTIPANTAYVRFSGYNNSITHGFIKGVSVESNLTSLNNAANVVINAVNGIKFDTSNKTITFVKPLYLTIGTQRYNYESTDTVLSYNSVSGSDVCVVYTNNALSCVARSAFNASTMVMIFGFNKNTINNPSTNNIFYPYYVNGTLYNPQTQKRNAVYVDGINGLDTNDGTADRPYKTIQKGINESPSIVYIKRGSYAETLDINGKTDLQIVPWGTPVFSTDVFDVPMIVVNRVLCRNSQNVYFQDVHANNPGSGNGAWIIIDVINGVFYHCWASNGDGGGFVATRLDGKFILCKAWNIGSSTYYNSDGFNLHGYGTTELIDCVAHDCYDDGISHHDGCIASIKGGEFWNCTGGGGIAPVNRYCEIDGVYCHDNKYGIESVQTDASLYDPYILVKNSVLKNNTAKDISIGAIPFKVLRCTFDTKQIASGADYVEID